MSDIEAMKKALEALEIAGDRDYPPPATTKDAITSLRQAITLEESLVAEAEAESLQQEHEIFCWHWEDRWGINHYADPKEPHPENAKPLYTCLLYTSPSPRDA